jgi:acetylornithine deacetylase/succinyl-diaminopimelate desuccinylase-like protein
MRDTTPAPVWDEVLGETVSLLSRMIQTDTTNPPGNELALGRYIASVLEDAGIHTLLVEPTPGRAAVIGRIRGTGQAQPILMLAHMDVVAADPVGWTVPPFGGTVRDGYVYGRGAIDDKGMLAANLMVMLLLQRTVARTGIALTRDVVFVATPDEEGPGEWGIGWLAAHHPDLLSAEFAINEGGRIRVVDGRPLYAAVQTAEKVANVVTVTARGTGGHAAIPVPDNAVALLCRAVARIAAHREPFRLLPTTSEFFQQLSQVWPNRAEARAMRDLASRDAVRSARAAARLARVPAFGAVLRTGISPTVLAGGSAHNVIPETASATLSVRTLPGDSLDDVVERLRRLVNDDHIEITITDRGIDAPASDFQSPMFAAIRDSIAALDPSIVTVPYLSTGATDSAHLRALGVQAFGLLPFPLEPDDERRMHGADERVPLTALLFGVRLLFDIMSRITA